MATAKDKSGNRPDNAPAVDPHYASKLEQIAENTKPAA